MDIRSLKTIETAEGVHLTAELSGVPARLVAYVLDVWCSVGLLLLMTIILGLFANGFEKGLMLFIAQGYLKGISAEIMAVALSLMTLTFFFAYYFFQEWLWNGKTIGKKLMKIRVVRNNGQPLGFWESFGRNLFRLVDVYLSGIGVVCMLFSSSEKRLGDYLVGSLVIVDEPSESQQWIKRSLALEDVASLSPDNPKGGTVPHLSYEEQALVQSFLERSGQLFSNSRKQLDALLRQYFADRLNLSEAATEEPGFLRSLIKK